MSTHIHYSFIFWGNKLILFSKKMLYTDNSKEYSDSKEYNVTKIIFHINAVLLNYAS